MNPALKWKLIVGFLLVFLAGGMTGAFITASRTFHVLVGPHHPGFSAERMRSRLRRSVEALCAWDERPRERAFGFAPVFVELPAHIAVVLEERGVNSRVHLRLVGERRIEQVRAQARNQRGWIMDTYLLRKRGASSC